MENRVATIGIALAVLGILIAGVTIVLMGVKQHYLPVETTAFIIVGSLVVLTVLGAVIYAGRES